MTNFDRRTILVTGASGGIGGARSASSPPPTPTSSPAAARSPALDALAAETGCRTLALDLTADPEVEAALGGLDLWGLVNCAGFGGEIATPMDTDMAVFDQVIAPQHPSALLVTKHASRSMVASDGAAPSSTSRARPPSSPCPATSPTARRRPRSTT